jgi:hypothetical protein
MTARMTVKTMMMQGRGKARMGRRNRVSHSRPAAPFWQLRQVSATARPQLGSARPKLCSIQGEMSGRVKAVGMPKTDVGAAVVVRLPRLCPTTVVPWHTPVTR